MAWKKSRHPLFRGDSAEGVAHPAPTANDSIVAHILYLLPQIAPTSAA